MSAEYRLPGRGTIPLKYDSAVQIPDPARWVSVATQPFRNTDSGKLLDEHRTREDRNKLYRIIGTLWKLRRRLLFFAVNGMSVFVIGLLAQVLLVRYTNLGYTYSYILQTAFSVQVSFLLSRYVTWRDRDVNFSRALLKFNMQQSAVAGIGISGYAALEHFGVNYIMANVLVTAVLTPVSFVSSDRWSMGERTRLRRSSFAASVPWPLLAVLTVQAGLSLRLVWSNTAFPDEALYLWAGHLEWQHWLHGTPIPNFSTFFSGAPVIFPPIGALADAAGGLAAARLLSLVFTLISSSLLYAVTRRIFDSRSALFAACLYAGLAATAFLGAFATYDAMALMFVCLATWLGVCATDKKSMLSNVVLLMAAAGLLILADATKYAAGLFTPVVIAGVTSLSWWRHGRRTGIRTGSVLIIVFLGLLAIAVIAGGKSYWEGITYTTLARQHGSDSAAFLIYVSGKWEGALAILASFGGTAFIFHSRSRPAAALALILVGAAFLVPVEQARIGTYTSLFKHIGYGAWFAAILAGHALASLPRAVPKKKLTSALRVSAAAALIVAIPGIPWAASHYGWPNTSKIVPLMQRVLVDNSGPVLADDRGNILDYYLHNTLGSRSVSGTFFFAYDDPTTGRHFTQRAAYADAIRQRYFSVVFLEFWDSANADAWVQGDIDHYGGYRLVATLPYSATGHHGQAMVWVRDRGSL